MGTVIFICTIVFSIVFISQYLIKHQFAVMKHSRVVEKTKALIDEEVCVTMTLENRSKVSIPYLFIREFLPKDIEVVGKRELELDGEDKAYNVCLAINKRERLKRIYKIKAKRRGVYFFERFNITLGDQFGLIEAQHKVKDSKELMVFPAYKKLSQTEFLNSSLSGDEVVRRFIFDDPLMVKGIREYTVNHRMKDIHWNSSLKAGKLMAKEYDYTTDREVVILLNVQCGFPTYNTVDSEIIEKGISLAMSISEFCMEQAVSTSFWTNSSLVGADASFCNKTYSSAYTMEPILEMGARISNWANKDFSKYLEGNINNFDYNNLYLIITPFLDESSQNILENLAYKGVDMKIFDISRTGIDNTGIINTIRLSEEVSV